MGGAGDSRDAGGAAAAAGAALDLGDPYYVGLAGVEVFDSCGNAVIFKHPTKQLTADPPDVNVLLPSEEEEEGGGFRDPRTVDKPVDGVPHTCDDLHQWLAPFTGGGDSGDEDFDEDKEQQDRVPNVVDLDLIGDHDEEDSKRVVQLGMVRIWNYNKSRTHSSAGARRDAAARWAAHLPGGSAASPRHAQGRVSLRLRRARAIYARPAALAAIEEHDRRTILKKGQKQPQELQEQEQEQEQLQEEQLQHEQLHQAMSTTRDVGDEATQSLVAEAARFFEMRRPTTGDAAARANGGDGTTSEGGDHLRRRRRRRDEGIGAAAAQQQQQQAYPSARPMTGIAPRAAVAEAKIQEGESASWHFYDGGPKQRQQR